MEVLSATQYLNFLQDETEEFEDEYFNEESRRSLTTSTNTLEDESTPLTIQSLKQEKNKQLEQFFLRFLLSNSLPCSPRKTLLLKKIFRACSITL